jgi:hypothetical protein
MCIKHGVTPLKVEGESDISVPKDKKTQSYSVHENINPF